MDAELLVLHLPALRDADPVIVGVNDLAPVSLSASPISFAARMAILGFLRAPIRLVAFSLLLLTAGCGVHGLSFVQDERVDIISPSDRVKVKLPLKIDWTTKDFAAGAGQGAFGILIDRTPQRSGKTLPWIFRGDDSCKGSTGRALCTSAEFLAERGVFMTTDTSFTVERVALLSGSQRKRQFHEATIVLLDEAGRRLGEGAWSVQFEVKKQT
jgi:hypothetical protein